MPTRQQQPVAFQPQARGVAQGGGLSAPIQAGGGSALLDFAQSMGQIMPAAASLAQGYVQARNAQAQAQVAQRFATVPDEELVRFREQEIGTGLSRHERRALDAQFGARMANARKRQFLQAIESGEVDPSTEDVDALVRAAIGEDIESYASEEFSATYAPMMQSAAQEIANIGAKAVGARVRQEIEQNYYSLIREQIEDARRQGGSPKEVARAALAVRSLHTDPDSGFQMDRARANGVLMQVASEMAMDGDEEAVNALLDTPLGDGGPALSKLKQWAEPSRRIRDAAQEVAQAKRREEAFGSIVNLIAGVYDGDVSSQQGLNQTGNLQDLGFSEQMVGSLYSTARSRERQIEEEAARQAALAQQQEFKNQLLGRNFNRLLAGTLESGDGAFGFGGVDDIEMVMPTGDVFRYSANDQRQDAIQVLVGRADERYQPEIEKRQRVLNALPEDDPSRALLQGELQELQEQRDKVVFSALQQNGITDFEPLRQEMQAGYYAATSGSANAPAVQRGFDRYMAAKAIDPVWAKRVAGSDSVAEFFETTDLAARELFGGDIGAAVEAARTGEENTALVQRFNEALFGRGDPDLQDLTDAAIEKVRGKIPFIPFTGERYSGFEGRIRDRILRQGKMIAGYGYVDAETAMNLAADRVAANTMLVNGIDVPTSEINLAIPQKLPDLSEAVAELVPTLPGYEDRDPREFALLPGTDAGRAFEVFDLATGLPVMPDHGAEFSFTVSGQEDPLKVPYRNMTRTHLDQLSRLLDEKRIVELESNRQKRIQEKARQQGIHLGDVDWRGPETPEGTRPGQGTIRQPEVDIGVSREGLPFGLDEADIEVGVHPENLPFIGGLFDDNKE